MNTYNVSAETYTLPEAFTPFHDEAARLFTEGVAGHISDGLESVEYGEYGQEVGRIQNEAVSGFFPWTDGGWQWAGCGDLRSEQSVGGAVGLIYGQIESAENDARKEFMSQNDGAGDPWEFDHDHPMRDEWGEFENEWLEQAFYMEVRAVYYSSGNSRNQSGSDEIVFSVRVNFDEYGRDGRGVTLFNRNILLGPDKAAFIESVARAAQDAKAAADACKAAPVDSFGNDISQ